MALLAACGGSGQEPVVLHATIIRPPRDTTRFALPATFRRCPGNRALLIEAIAPRGDGVLTLLRYGDSLASKTYSIVNPTDTALGAAVGIRYLIRDIPHMLMLDTGTAAVTWKGNRLTARVQGSGIENAVRTRATIDYADVAEARGAAAAPADSLACARDR